MIEPMAIPAMAPPDNFLDFEDPGVADSELVASDELSDEGKTVSVTATTEADCEPALAVTVDT